MGYLFQPSLITRAENYWEAYLRELRKRKETYEKEFGVAAAENAGDVRRAKKEGKQTALFEYEEDITALLGNGLLQAPCEDFAERDAEAKLAHDMSLERIDMFYKYGMRCSHICGHFQSYLSHGRLSRYRDVAGLSETGLEVVKRMNKLGIIIDLYNCGSRSLLDALERSKHPCVISHSGARGLFPGNIARHTDEEIKALAEKGGVIGISALNNTLSTDKRQGIWNTLDHIDYIGDLMGVDHVGIGADNTFDYQWDLPCYTWSLKKEGVGFPSEYFEGFQNPDEWPNVTRGLVNRGYSDQEIEKIVGGNALRVMDEVLK